MVNNPKQPIMYDIFAKNVIIERDHEKGNLIFFFAPIDFLKTKFWKPKMPGTSDTSLELQDMLTNEKGKNDERLNK